MTDKEFEYCCERIRIGDRDGLKDIYEAYVQYIYAIIFRVLQNKENAEDVTADFFIKLWDLADRYKGGNGHKAWMTTIARNMAIDSLRSRKRELLHDEIPDIAGGSEEGGAKSGTQYGQAASEVETEVIGNMSIEEALSVLNDSERQIINMKVLGDMTFKEISDVLKIPMGTITWRYQNAMKKLRRYGYE